MHIQEYDDKWSAPKWILYEQINTITLNQAQYTIFIESMNSAKRDNK